MLFYDFEVFKYDWLVVIGDTSTKTFKVIVNNQQELVDYVDKTNDVWVGYNSTHFDQWLVSAILKGLDPYKVTQEIIVGKKSGWQLGLKPKIINYDTMANDFKSLKQLEGFMGVDIHECSVPFNIQRKLTEDELKDVIEYCTADVKNTMSVFMKRKSVFDSVYGLIKEYNLSLWNMSKSVAQLSAMILGAKKQDHYDEMDITLMDTLKIDKYSDIVKWYDKKDFYHNKYETDIMGVHHVFGIGGIHGAIPNYIGEGLFVMSDVASQHPALMIEYDFLSRNIEDKSKFKEIRDNRIVYKAAKNPRQSSLKLLLNATNGAAKDRYNQLYDPRQNNNVCINAQLGILDLIEQVEDICELIQSNTDGILVKLKSRDDYDEYIRRCDEWSNRTRLILEHDEYSKVIQKDVNNYIIIEPNGKYKSKGAYVKGLTELDNDLKIVNNAIIEYFVNGTPPEDTIKGCNKIKDFQMICKCSGKYDHMQYGNKIMSEKVIRVFATKDQNAAGVYRSKDGKPHKINNTPKHCKIINSNVNDKRVGRWLNKQWYIDLAWSRIGDFYGRDVRQLSLWELM
jgi:hypothetical protein